MGAPRLAILRSLLIALILTTCSAAADTGPQSVPSVTPESEARESVPAGERLVVLDWTLLETLIALGFPPAAAADLEGYQTWVGAPALPEGIVDIGLRNQPNLELLSQLNPDRFLIPPLFANVAPLLSRIGPVETLPLYSDEGPLWPNLREFTRAVARYTPEPNAAGKLINRVESRLDAIAGALPADLPPFLIVQFMDSRHVRVFGDNSLYDAVFERLGIANAWQGKTNAWGFSLVGIEALAEKGNLSASSPRLLVVEPMPPGLREEMQSSGLWQSLPAVSRGGVLYLPPAWSFGGLPSAQRFAELLQEGLQQ